MMTPKAQRIAIAEACGTMKWSYALAPSYALAFGRFVAASVPKYTEDLSAMHDAEKVLTDEKNLEYSEALEQVVEGRFMANNAEDMRRLRSATAAQRAEAFLRTIGKWEGE
jgi:hypothetical protein